MIIHATNIVGIGAVQLVSSLLPELEKHSAKDPQSILLPDRGPLAHYSSSCTSVDTITHKRLLPNKLSRLVECFVFRYRHPHSENLLVLGDLPLNWHSRQIVLVNTQHLIEDYSSSSALNRLSYYISRKLFTLLSSKISGAIVQTDVMKQSLLTNFPQLNGKIHIIRPPVPQWLADTPIALTSKTYHPSTRLRCLYPAANYPHKNHALLKKLTHAKSVDIPVREIIFTIDKRDNPNDTLAIVNCVGKLSPSELIAEYQRADILLFLSSAESFGFPLLEAMHIGLPIVCPDLPYARDMCGSQAFYFDVDDVESLTRCIKRVHEKLQSGWYPDWRAQLDRHTKNWSDVASEVVHIVENG